MYQIRNEMKSKKKAGAKLKKITHIYLNTKTKKNMKTRIWK